MLVGDRWVIGRRAGRGFRREKAVERPTDRRQFSAITSQNLPVRCRAQHGRMRWVRSNGRKGPFT